MASSVAFASTPSGIISSLFHNRDLISSKSCVSPRLASLVVRSKPRTVCSLGPAENESSIAHSAGKLATALALVAVVSTAPMATAPQPALADIAGLTPCKESKAFAKREKQQIKKLENRLKKYAPDSAPALAIQATVEKTKRRFEFYGRQGLLCGTDGLPHLIVDGDQAHLGEFVIPGIFFLYIAGWIGWVGRSYLIQIRSSKKPTEKEIIIDVPLASRLVWKGFIWPLLAVSEFRNGQLIEDAANITVSPR
eukprot:c24638_g2_i1 orf=201-956(+)